jgi:hypothetical protein
VLDITYSLRAPTTSAFPAMQPVIGPIHAGHDIQIVIHDSLRGSDAPALGSLGVVVVNNGVTGFTGPDGTYYSYYYPDGTSSAYTDPVIIAWGTANSLVDSAYTFPDLSAGNDIVVRHTETGTVMTFDATTDVDATLSSREFPSESYSTSDGDGEITLYTNGFVHDLETIGDLRVGTITSTGDDVVLRTAQDTASILDAGDINDGTPRVAGTHITLLAGTQSGRIGGTGAIPDFLEIQSSLSGRGWLRAIAARNILIDQVLGTLFVSGVVSIDDADVSLRTRFGSIRNDVDDGSLRIIAGNVDLVAVGGSVGADSPDRSADIAIDTSADGRLWALSLPGTAIGFLPPQGVYITEASGGLQVLGAQSPQGDVRLTVPYASTGDPTDLIVLTDGTTIDGLTIVTEGDIIAGGAVILNVGQDLFAPADTVIRGATVTVHAEFGQGAVDPVGSYLYFGGGVTGHQTQIFGGYGTDVFVFDSTLLGGQTDVYGGISTKDAGDDGNDSFYVYTLQSMTGLHVAAAGDPFAGTLVRDTLALWGQGGDNDFHVQTWGGGDAVGHDYCIELRGGGAREGINTLTIDGTDAADLFLFRGEAAIPEMPDAVRPAFVAQIDTATGTVERVDYDTGLNGGITVNGGNGDDTFVFDDTSAATRVYGQDGNDTFVVGQFFATPRIEPAVQPGDAFDTTLTEFGYASRGISAPTILYGGAGNDRFLLNTYRAELRVEAATGADSFQLLAVHLTGGTPLAHGFLSLDGGVDAATMTIRTAGPASAIAVAEGTTDVQETVIHGAGLNVDSFHLGRPAPLAAPFSAPAPKGLPGDTLAPLVPLVVPTTSRLPGTGTVIIVETDGSTRLISGVQETDTYTIALADPPTARAYVTISAAYGGGIPYAEISIDGGLTWATTLVLVFEAGATAPQTVMVRLTASAGDHHPVLRALFAPSAAQQPGVVVETLSSVVTSDDPRYENADVRNVYINLTAIHPTPPPPPNGGTTPSTPGTPASSTPTGSHTAGTLPPTGGDGAAAPLAVALIAMLLGIGMLLLGRRRRVAAAPAAGRTRHRVRA